MVAKQSKKPKPKISKKKTVKSTEAKAIPEKMPFWQVRQYPVAEKKRLSTLILDSVVNDALSFRQACIFHKVPQTTFLAWVDEDKELSANYARARDFRHDKLADEILEVSRQKSYVVKRASHFRHSRRRLIVSLTLRESTTFESLKLQ